MGTTDADRRVNAAAVRGRRRSQLIATRLGAGLKEGRSLTGIPQREAASRAGISQPRWSELERGLGHTASLQTWAVAAAVVGDQLAAFLEQLPSAERPRDLEHLRRQSTLVELSKAGGWTARPELAARFGEARPLSIDVALVRRARVEGVAAEIWDWLDDVGVSLRGLEAKVTSLTMRLQQEQPGIDWLVRGLFLVRGTRRNRLLVGALRPLFDARFPGSSIGWLEALRSPEAPLPLSDGFLWSGATSKIHVRRRPEVHGRARYET